MRFVQANDRVFHVTGGIEPPGSIPLSRIVTPALSFTRSEMYLDATVITPVRSTARSVRTSNAIWPPRGQNNAGPMYRQMIWAGLGILDSGLLVETVLREYDSADDWPVSSLSYRGSHTVPSHPLSSSETLRQPVRFSSPRASAGRMEFELAATRNCLGLLYLPLRPALSVARDTPIPPALCQRVIGRICSGGDAVRDKGLGLGEAFLRRYQQCVRGCPGDGVPCELRTRLLLRTVGRRHADGAVRSCSGVPSTT